MSEIKGRTTSTATGGDVSGQRHGSWSATNPDTTPGAVCAELPSCNATGHSVRCPKAVATVTIDQIVAAAEADDA